MLIPDPDFYPSQIPDLGLRIQKQQQKRRAKKNFVLAFLVATNMTKFKIILCFEMAKKETWAN
jgi:hypothetical protein